MWKLRQKTVDVPLDMNVQTVIRLRRIIRLLASLQDMLTDESASDEFFSIIRLSTDFIPKTDYPSRRTIRL